MRAVSFQQRQLAGAKRRCKGYHHGPHPISGYGEPRWVRRWWSLIKCACDDFAPASRDVVHCARCHHAEKGHASFRVEDAIEIKKKVLMLVAMKFGGRRYAVPQEPGARATMELNTFVPRNLELTMALEKIDIYKDCRLFALLDTGCNRSSHGRFWRKCRNEVREQAPP